MKKLICLFFSLVLMTEFIHAQEFKHQASVTGIKESGLYKIPLTPEYKQYMSLNLHDLRIMDSSHKEVPYVMLREPLLKSKSDFVAYEIVSQKHFSTYSEIIIHNPNKDKISNIAFNINNSDAYKYCTIEGSEDGKQWYTVSELQELSLVYNEVYTNQYKCIYFPLNNYTYFRLLVDDWNSQPLKINTAGYFRNSVIAGKLNDVNFTKAISNDVKNKRTVIALVFPNNQSVDRIDFKIKEPRLFMRHAIIYAKREHKIKDKTEMYQETFLEFDLKSDEPLYFDIPQLNEKELFIEIENKDNPPLEIESIHCKQLETYLVSDFKANQAYTLMCGDEKLKTPEYDLINFVSQIPQLLPVAKLDAIKEVPKVTKVEMEKAKPFYETQQFLWFCLGLGAIIIFFFSKSLLKDMGKDRAE